MDSSKQAPVNYPLAVIREWQRGCTCAPKDRPGECQECTDGAMRAIQRWFDCAEQAAVEMDAADFTVWFLQQAAEGVKQIRGIEEFEQLLAQREAEYAKNKHA